jgi:hypothetical protein
MNSPIPPSMSLMTRSCAALLRSVWVRGAHCGQHYTLCWSKKLQASELVLRLGPCFLDVLHEVLETG